MALTAAKIRRLSDAGRAQNHVQDTEVAYKGAFLALGASIHGTAGKVGRVYAYNDEAGAIYWGLMTSGGGSGSSQGADSVTGDATDAASLDANKAASITDAMEIDAINVTGASATTDAGLLVYATDDDTLTLTRPTVGCPIGFVLEWRGSGTSCRVQMFSVAQVMAIALGGSGKRTWCIGSVAPVLTASGNLLTGIVAPHGGVITDVYAICVRGPTDVDVDIDANLEIGGTNVTGGVVALVTADVAGDKKAGTAVTAANVFHEGDLIDVEGVVNTAGTITDPGLYNVYIEYTTLAGL